MRQTVWCVTQRVARSSNFNLNFIWNHMFFWDLPNTSVYRRTKKPFFLTCNLLSQQIMRIAELPKTELNWQALRASRLRFPYDPSSQVQQWQPQVLSAPLEIYKDLLSLSCSPWTSSFRVGALQFKFKILKFLCTFEALILKFIIQNQHFISRNIQDCIERNNAIPAKISRLSRYSGSYAWVQRGLW